MKQIMLFFLLLTAFCFAGASATLAADVIGAQAEALDIAELEESVPDSAREAVEDLKLTETPHFEEALSGLWNSMKEKAVDAVRDTLQHSSSVIVAAVFCSVIAALYPKSGSFASLACILAISAAMVTHSTSLAQEGEQALDELNTFSKVLLPTLTATAAAGGNAASAAAKYAASVLFLDIAMSASRRFVMPLIYAYIASSIASAAFGGSGLKSACSLLKWAAVMTLTLIVLAFTAYLSISGIISGTVDAAAVRAARVTMSTVLPVVGGMISDAAAAVLAGASVLKGAIGVFGLIVVCAVIAVPFIKLGAGYLIYKAAAGLAGAAAQNEVSQLISALSSSLGLMLGLVGSVGIMLFISIVSVIRTVI